MNDTFHTTMLKKALSLAESVRGFCAPNPAVGAVIVKNNQVVAEGVHRGPWTAHAEVDAISQCNDVSGGRLYVTLEPCCHWGRTPPCTDAIIQANIETVYFGYQDPHDIVQGKGAEKLKAAGIACHYLTLPEIENFYESYTYWHQHHCPWVTAKLAMSLDGKIAGPNGAPIMLTGEAARLYTHECRKKSDALLTTAKTILHDDPQLNVRLPHEVIKKNVYIVDQHLKISLSARVFETAKKLTVFHGKKADEKKRSLLINKSVNCIAISNLEEGLDIQAIFQIIGEQDGVHDLWIEAGGKFFSFLLKNKLLNRALIYMAPTILGSHHLSAFDSALSFEKEVKNYRWFSLEKDAILDVKFR